MISCPRVRLGETLHSIVNDYQPLFPTISLEASNGVLSLKVGEHEMLFEASNLMAVKILLEGLKTDPKAEFFICGGRT